MAENSFGIEISRLCLVTSAKFMGTNLSFIELKDDKSLHLSAEAIRGSSQILQTSFTPSNSSLLLSNYIFHTYFPYVAFYLCSLEFLPYLDDQAQH